MATARFVFLGTGTSERVPRVTCLAAQPPTCPVCTDSQRPGSNNYRRNTSLLVQASGADERQVNIIVDAGKSFYEASMQWFPQFGVTSLDAVVLTHHHADAIAGLDDLRDWTNRSSADLPVFARSIDMQFLAQSHFYLVDRSKATSGGGVAKLSFVETDEKPFGVLGVEFTPLPVEHGRNVTANGYRIGGVCYISDVSAVPESTMERIKGCRVLILDALRPARTHGSHLTLEAAVELAREISAEKTWLTDMAHDIEHDSVNAELAKLDFDIELAYDGLSFKSEV